MSENLDRAPVDHWRETPDCSLRYARCPVHGQLVVQTKREVVTDVFQWLWLWLCEACRLESALGSRKRW